MLNDLAAHAKNYPPQFDTPQDRQRATQDVKVISGMLDTLVNVPNPTPDLLLRAAHLGSMGHNLEIPGAADKANALFLRLPQLEPAHPRGNYLYGTFLAGAGKPREALLYLEKALAAAHRGCRLHPGHGSYLSLKDQDRALKYLEDYSNAAARATPMRTGSSTPSATAASRSGAASPDTAVPPERKSRGRLPNILPGQGLRAPLCIKPSTYSSRELMLMAT